MSRVMVGVGLCALDLGQDLLERARSVPPAEEGHNENLQVISSHMLSSLPTYHPPTPPKGTLLSNRLSLVLSNPFLTAFPSPEQRAVRSAKYELTRISVITPIRVSHFLDIDIYFSSYGIGAKGERLRYPGQGAVRVMRVRRKIMLPSVSLSLLFVCGSFWSKSLPMGFCR
jgi:hypothetical protein